MNLPPIRERWLEAKTLEIKHRPQNNLRASSVGRECDRFHYHSIKDWQEKTLHDPITQSIFDEGHLHESSVIRKLQDLGFEIVQQQCPIQIDKPLITGHIDGILRWENKDYPFDVKSSSSYSFKKIDSAEDLLYSKKSYHRAYIAQLQLYLLMTNNTVGCFILKDKQSGEIKPIWCQIDYDYCEKILKRAERVYKALEKDTPPERTKDTILCHDCVFAHICLPDLKFNSELREIASRELAATMDRMNQIEAIAKEYHTLDEQIKEVKEKLGSGEFVCGDYLLKITQHKKVTKVPLTWREEETSYLKKEILKIGTGKPSVLSFDGQGDPILLCPK